MNTMKEQLQELQQMLAVFQHKLDDVATTTHDVISMSEPVTGMPFIGLFTAFLLACFVGYFVVWSVTPALHSPLMGVTNAISSVIIVGAIIAAGPSNTSLSSIFGTIAVALASVNIFGGFIVTQRMLQMFKKKQQKPKKGDAS